MKVNWKSFKTDLSSGIREVKMVGNYFREYTKRLAELVGNVTNKLILKYRICGIRKPPRWSTVSEDLQQDLRKVYRRLVNRVDSYSHPLHEEYDHLKNKYKTKIYKKIRTHGGGRESSRIGNR